MKRSELIMAIFTDYSKAFDALNFYALIKKCIL